MRFVCRMALSSALLCPKFSRIFFNWIWMICLCASRSVVTGMAYTYLNGNMVHIEPEWLHDSPKPSVALVFEIDPVRPILNWKSISDFNSSTHIRSHCKILSSHISSVLFTYNSISAEYVLKCLPWYLIHNIWTLDEVMLLSNNPLVNQLHL